MPGWCFVIIRRSNSVAGVVGGKQHKAIQTRLSKQVGNMAGHYARSRRPNSQESPGIKAATFSTLLSF